MTAGGKEELLEANSMHLKPQDKDTEIPTAKRYGHHLNCMNCPHCGKSQIRVLVPTTVALECFYCEKPFKVV